MADFGRFIYLIYFSAQSYWDAYLLKKQEKNTFVCFSLRISGR